MIRFVAVVALACVLAPSAGSAQSHQQPYAGYQQRSIKALSDAQIGELRAGKGTVWRWPPSSTDIQARAMCWIWPMPCI